MHTEDLFDLRRLAQPALQVTRPPAVDIRRRGTVRRRHRLMATVAAGAAVAMLATGVAYGATQSLDGLGWLDRSADPTPTRVVPPPMGTPRATGPSDPRTTSTDAPSQPGPTPSAPSPSAPTESSSTTSQGAAQPTWGNVPTAEDLWWNEPGDLSQKTEETGWPSEQPPSACVVDPSELRATTVLTRTFGGGSDGRLEEVALVMGFASEADAVAARDRISAWYRGCIERLRADGAVKTFPTEPDQTVLGSGVEPDGTATVFAQIGWQTPEQAKQEVGTWEDSVVVQRGNRLVWLVTPKRDVQSNNCTPTAEDAELRCVTANQVPTVARLLGRR